LLSLALLWPAATSAQQNAPSDTVVVVGVVYDSLAHAPVRLATVRVAGTDRSTLTDDGGHYRLTGPAGDLEIEVRRIGFQPTAVRLTAPGGVAHLDVSLHALPVGLEPVVVNAADDPARRIIERAIARKHERLATIHDYSYGAFVKFELRDLDMPPDSASAVVLITETRTTAYWEQPGRYQERILARRQSSNIDAEQNLVSVGEIVNFNRNRVDLRRYSLVSPIADDATTYYRYQVLDTLVIEGRQAFRLAIEPRTQASPLFAGTIDIADSTYDVLGIDVGVNDAVQFRFIRNLRYRQVLRDMGDDHWMPAEIRLSGDIIIALPVAHLAIPIPGFPRRPGFEHVATLGDFRFNEGNRPPGLREYRVVVDAHADHADSATWATRGGEGIPLSPAEHAAWARVDSLQRMPPFRERVRRGIAFASLVVNQSDAFGYNRVDGLDVGLGRTTREIPGVVLDTRVGYATAAARWQYRLGGEVRLWEAQRVWLGASYHDETMTRPVLGLRPYGPDPVNALLFGIDRLDYYRERGFTISAHGKLIDFTQLDLRYTDELQSSLSLEAAHEVFPSHFPVRPNPVIADGHLRSVSATLAYDSRPMIRRRRVDSRIRRATFTRITLNAEVASPRVIPNDFAFHRYWIELERRQRTLGLGLTTVQAAAGIATGVVPPQREFGVDLGLRGLAVQQSGVRSLGDTIAYGTRVAMFTIRHDFGRLLFAKLPLVRNLPFTLQLEGGSLWSQLAGLPGTNRYSRIGFELGNLTPFLMPLDFGLRFNWPLSSDSFQRFQFGIDFGGP